MLNTEILARAKNIRAIRGHHYLKLNDLHLSRIDIASKDKIRTPRLKKLGTFKANIPVGYSQVYRVFASDIVEQIPEEWVEHAVAFKVHQHSAEFNPYQIQESVPTKVSVYGLKEGAKVPDAIKDGDIVFNKVRYSSQTIHELEK